MNGILCWCKSVVSNTSINCLAPTNSHVTAWTPVTSHCQKAGSFEGPFGRWRKHPRKDADLESRRRPGLHSFTASAAAELWVQWWTKDGHCGFVVGESLEKQFRVLSVFDWFIWFNCRHASVFTGHFRSVPLKHNGVDTLQRRRWHTERAVELCVPVPLCLNVRCVCVTTWGRCEGVMVPRASGSLCRCVPAIAGLSRLALFIYLFLPRVLLHCSVWAIEKSDPSPLAAATRCRQPFRHNRWSGARPGFVCARAHVRAWWCFDAEPDGEGEDDERGFGGRQFCWKCVDGSIKLSDRNEMTLRARDKVRSRGQLSPSFFFWKDKGTKHGLPDTACGVYFKINLNILFFEVVGSVIVSLILVWLPTAWKWFIMK